MPLLHQRDQEPRHFCQKQLLLPQNSPFLSFWLVSNPPRSSWCCWPRGSPLTPCCSAWRLPHCPHFPWVEVASGERHCAASSWREHQARALSWRVSWGNWGPCTASCSQGFYRHRVSVSTNKSWVIFRISSNIPGTVYGPRKYNEHSSRQQQNVEHLLHRTLWDWDMEDVIYGLLLIHTDLAGHFTLAKLLVFSFWIKRQLRIHEILS